MKTCVICKNSFNNRTYIVREMFFGWKDEFEYFECNNCGCLQINGIPADLEKYYPSNYYSYGKLKKVFPLKIFLKNRIFRHYFVKPNLIGYFFANRMNPPLNPEWFNRANLSFDAKILDLGSGSGELLARMHNAGFRNILGVDPYIENDLELSNGIKILKKEILNVDDDFDFIILHHSFEHMADPLLVLKKLYQILRPNRYVLIRIPVSSSYAWKEYNVNWVQLDAPRHLFLHSIDSMQLLATQTGFQIENIVFDSSAFQFWGSEQYLRNVPLRSDNSYLVNPDKSIFTLEQIRIYEKKAIELNDKNEGDSACFYLYKPV